MHPLTSLLKLPLLLCGLALPVLAADPSCDFQAVGDPRNGLLFIARTQRSDLTVSSALGQFQQIALDGGYELGGELIQGNSGRLSFLQASNSPALVVWVDADNSGNVSLTMQLARNQKADVAGVKTEFCSLLGKLKGGSEGDAVAAAARSRSGLGRFIAVKAVQFSADLSREVKQALRGPAAKGKLSRALIGSGAYAGDGEYREAFAPLQAKYLGRKYEIDGQLHVVSRDTLNREMRITFLVTPTRGLLGIRQDAEYNNLNFQISCTLASDQSLFFSTLSEGNWVKLVGTVTAINPGGIELTDCRQAN